MHDPLDDWPVMLAVPVEDAPAPVEAAATPPAPEATVTAFLRPAYEPAVEGEHPQLRSFRAA